MKPNQSMTERSMTVSREDASLHLVRDTIRVIRVRSGVRTGMTISGGHITNQEAALLAAP